MNARRAQVCELIAAGRTNVQIAAELGYSVPVVKKEIAHAMAYYGVESRAALAVCWEREKRSRRTVRQAETLGLA